MNAVDEYRDCDVRHTVRHWPTVTEYQRKISLADAAISELEAERDRLAKAEAALEERDAEAKRIAAIASSQSNVLRALTEWAEDLPEQARNVERAAAETRAAKGEK